MRNVWWVFILLLSVVGARAQEQAPDLNLNVFLYGDNTEFIRNPYREGETLLGAQTRLQFGIPLGDRSRLYLGVFADNRWGSEKAFELVRPVFALEIGGPDDRFVFGTLRSGQMGRSPTQGLWPDESGPHGLIPPLQVDTLSLTRGYEVGLQWLRSRPGWDHDLWISWQRLNTSEQRERFDLGLTTVIQLMSDDSRALSFVAQGHIVHEGGQLFHVGAVGDSLAGGPGLRARWIGRRSALQADALVIFSFHNPDRSDTAREDRLQGNGQFIRLAWELGDWRTAYMYWNSKRFIKWEGDPNYGSLTDNGTIVRARTYTECSVSRRFQLSTEASLVVAARLYWIDGNMDYSYRVATAIDLHRWFDQ